ncbi:class I SAM-dependent methyltransferase [Clostridiaceae bacterium M8S5]|nr:class I SAM-dependent methyltransferase [Clostridiaceae bacterium M8S5]
MPIEQMSNFFTARVDTYDNHMLNTVDGCKEGYKIMAECVPNKTKELLDLGCGTGLELEEIFKKLPDVNVTGIDLTEAMLKKLQEKYPDKNLNLIHGSYFDYEFEIKKYDTAISFQTMHHFEHDAKIGLYKKIYKALKDDSIYIECDYMVKKQEDENFLFSENKKIREEQGIKDGEFYHFDTPCTVNNQIDMLSKAGFKMIEKIWHYENSVILIAYK